MYKGYLYGTKGERGAKAGYSDARAGCTSDSNDVSQEFVLVCKVYTQGQELNRCG